MDSLKSSDSSQGSLLEIRASPRGVRCPFPRAHARELERKQFYDDSRILESLSLVPAFEVHESCVYSFVFSFKLKAFPIMYLPPHSLFFLMFIIFESKRECEQRRGRERGRHRIKSSSMLQAPSCQHRARQGLELRNSERS